MQVRQAAAATYYDKVVDGELQVDDDDDDELLLWYG